MTYEDLIELITGVMAKAKSCRDWDHAPVTRIVVMDIQRVLNSDAVLAAIAESEETHDARAV